MKAAQKKIPKKENPRALIPRQDLGRKVPLSFYYFKTDYRLLLYRVFPFHIQLIQNCLNKEEKVRK